MHAARALLAPADGVGAGDVHVLLAAHADAVRRQRLHVAQGAQERLELALGDLEQGKGEGEGKISYCVVFISTVFVIVTA